MKKYYPYYMTTIPMAIVSLIVTSCSSDNTPIINPSIDTMTVSENNTNHTSDNTGAISSGKINLPIDRGLDRVTKKTFGRYISPSDSPISPEKFTGYHTGIDFETYPSEQDKNVVIRSICTGPLISKKWATGYGGVAVQQCQFEKENVTVVYGHLKLESVHPQMNSMMQSGERIGILGKGYSRETDMERKHLHLSIYRGSTLDIRGYVSTSKELSNWIDPSIYLKGN